MISTFLAFLVRIGFGGVVDRALLHIERRVDLENSKEALKAQTTIALANAAFKEAQVIAE